MTFEQEIHSWDGKSSSDIAAIYNSHVSEKYFVSGLIDFLKKEGLQKGVTWLLKYYLDNDHSLEAKEIAVIYKQLLEFKSWEARLHVLQCIPNMPIGESEKKSVEVFLRSCLADNNKFVRAWAYNGFVELSLQYPEYNKEAKQFIEMAMKDEAPSAKARIRNIVKKGF